MDEKAEFPDWEFIHNNSDEPPLVNPDHFSLHSPHNHSNDSIHSNSATDPSSEVDRNFQDSYVSNQLFPSAETYLIKQPSSSSSSSTTTTTSELLLDDSTGTGGGGFDSKEEEEVVDSAMSVEEEEEDRRVVWWKVPFEVFKYWVSRVTPLPLYSLSLAAFLGIVLLGRRFYNMKKRKTLTSNLNLSLHHNKKVSQLMGRVARLNEAFSVVRRVPIVRPSLPASSVTLRPVMSMR